MSSRLTLLFQVTTDPNNVDFARAHSGGWSESIWRGGDDTNIETINQIALFRARLLPSQAAIVGYRQQVYVIDGNTITPGGANTGLLNHPGSSRYDTDLPQVALECKVKSTGVANQGRILLRGMPDGVMIKGEYGPTPEFNIRVINYLDLLRASQCRFLGRNLANPNVRVTGIANAVLSTADNLGAAVGNWVRLLRVRDTFGRPVSGTFRVSAVAGFNYTLANFDADIVVQASGRARKDELQLFPITSGAVGRARVKKVGRPFESYRGRASKRRAG